MSFTGFFSGGYYEFRLELTWLKGLVYLLGDDLNRSLQDVVPGPLSSRNLNPKPMTSSCGMDLCWTGIPSIECMVPVLPRTPKGRGQKPCPSNPKAPTLNPIHTQPGALSPTLFTVSPIDPKLETPHPQS